MNGVKFGDKHSITDWDLLMTARNIGDAEVDESYVKIPGSNGEKDLTEAFGRVKYSSRVLSPTFDMFQTPVEWLQLKDEITNYLHGKSVRIIFDTDENYYYLGRCKVKDFTPDKTVAHITIEAKCKPFKYKITPTVITKTVSAGNTYTYQNERMETIPTFTASSSMTIEFKGNTYSISSGTYTNLDIEFEEGENNIKVISGSGTLTVTYQEGKL